MILFSAADIIPALMVALIVDALFGEPDWLWRRISHPVVWFGKAISVLDTHFNKHGTDQVSGRVAGVFVLICLVLSGLTSALIVQALANDLSVLGAVLTGLIASSLVAQRSLFEHVRAVQDTLASHDLEQARFAVSMIVGRDPNKLDEAGIARAAIESLAENFSDGIVAPVFWFLLFGLPGLVVYKIVNTADSMIGHRNARYLHFGWASARVDDLLNLLPARLTAVLLLLSPLSEKKESRAPGICALWRLIVRDAPLHRSPNAGWPEAAMAGRLGVALSGPRYYGNDLVDEPFVNAEATREIGADEIARALCLFQSGCVVQFVLIAVLGIGSLTL